MVTALALTGLLVLHAGFVGEARAGEASLFGEVVEAGDEEPLSSASVEIDGRGSVLTATGGGYRLSALTAGKYHVSARLAGFKSQAQDVTLSAGRAQRLNFALRLAKWDDGMCCNIAGVVRDARSAPLRAVKVVFASVLGDNTVLRAETDGRGRYTIPTDFHLAGEYVAFVQTLERLPSVRTVRVQTHWRTPETRVDFVVDRSVPEEPPRQPASSTGASGREFAGVVRDASGAALEGAEVTVLSASRPADRSRAYTDSTGSFAVQAPESDLIIAVAHARGYAVAARSLRLGSAGPASLDFALVRRE